jgi:hypothetical protein
MAWNEKLSRTFARRCSECGKAFADSEIRQEIGVGHAMHVECYEKVLDDIERGVLGDSGENLKPGHEHLKRFLDGAEDAKRRALAYERNKELWGEDAAKRIDEVATWITNIKRKKQSKS